MAKWSKDLKQCAQNAANRNLSSRIMEQLVVYTAYLSYTKLTSARFTCDIMMTISLLLGKITLQFPDFKYFQTQPTH